MRAIDALRRFGRSWPGDTLLPVLLGLAATLGFAPWGWVGLTLLAPAGLLWLYSEVTAGRAAWRGFVFGLAHFGLGIYWVSISIHRYGGGPFWLAWLMVLLLAGYMAFYPALIGYLLRRWQWPRALTALVLLPLLWLFAELFRGWFGSGFPWLSLGYAFIDTPLARLAPVIGVYGLSAFVILFSGAVWLAATGSRRDRQYALVAVLLVVVPISVLPAPGEWTSSAGPPIDVSLVQGNIPQNIKWVPGRLAMTQAHYRSLTETEWGRRLIIWPEVAIPALRHQVQDYLNELDTVARTQGSTLLLGVLVHERADAPLYNSLISLGVDPGIYYKRHLVPFGEYFPVPKFLLDVGGLLGLQYSDFSGGPPGQAPLKLGAQTLGISICFEDVFGRDIRKSLPAAGLLVNVTNDAWFDDSSAAPQHLQIARMRALEMSRPLLRVANTGVSGVIEANGQLTQTTPQFQEAVLRATVTPRQGLTPYARWGDLPLWLVASIGLVLLFCFGRLRA